MRLKRIWLCLALLLACLVGSSFVPQRPRIDYGRWRVVVLHGDDFGLEGWVPDEAAATALPELGTELPPRLRSYARSTLESAAEVDSIAGLLMGWRDLDGLPAILQANTIVAAAEFIAPQGPAIAPTFGFVLRPSGVDTGAYARPGLWESVARAESLGVWRVELHGLTHLDLALLREASDTSDPLTWRARALQVHAAPGLGRASELGHGDSRDEATIAAALDFFHQRFQRLPVSVIAPDYRWNADNERSWREAGIRVVQAKSEQVDPSLRPGRWSGRLRKRWGAVADRRRGEMLYLDRSAQLEPYGDPDPAAEQGAEAAYAAVRSAWRRGQPAIVSTHRLQWSHLDAALPRACRRQWAALFGMLAADGGARFLVDAELEQLERQSWSVLARGGDWVVRNFSSSPRRVQLPDGSAPFTVGPGTTRIAKSAASLILSVSARVGDTEAVAPR